MHLRLDTTFYSFQILILWAFLPLESKYECLLGEIGQNIIQDQIPLPLNFLILNTPLNNNDLINKDIYYNIFNRLSSIPLIDSYYRMKLNKIIYKNIK